MPIVMGRYPIRAKHDNARGAYGGRTGKPWTPQENELVVPIYFEMLLNELSGREFTKSWHHDILSDMLEVRTPDAVEDKFRNITAVLMGMGEAWIEGYTPLFNFQQPLVPVVERQLDKCRESLVKAALRRKADFPEYFQEIEVKPPSALPGDLTSKRLSKVYGVSQDYDVAARDNYNRELGEEGERLVVEHEKSVLRKAGLDSVAEDVVWVSKVEGDGAGYDIRSFTPDRRRRLIEVKTTNGWERTPFYVTRNEKRVSCEKREEWCLFRLWDFSRKPKAFELNSAELEECDWSATNYQVRLNDNPVRRREV